MIENVSNSEVSISEVSNSNIRLKTTSKASLNKELKEYFWKEFLKDPKVTDMKNDIESIRFYFF